MNVIFIHTLKVIYAPNLSYLHKFELFISFQQLLIGDNSWWQMMTMKIILESWHFAHISPLGCGWKFHLIFFRDNCHQLSTVVDSRWQQLTADKNENHPRGLKFGTHITFRVWLKVPFQIFGESCHQLSIAVDSWWQLMTMKINIEFWNLAHISLLG